MAKEAPRGPLSGFRDLLAEHMLPRQQMIATIKGVYERYGFTPLDTPALERQETLVGKYGEEGEKLMYTLSDHGGRRLALHYDLTVPLARVVAQHRAELTLPYKRYQVGPVWRGESPQVGRYREFVQFDADTVGSTSALAEAETLSMMAETMHALGTEALIRVNHRKLLDALVEKAEVQQSHARSLIGMIDKVEKIGNAAVLTQIRERFSEQTAELVGDYLGVTGSSQERLQHLEHLLGGTAAAQAGGANLQAVFSLLRATGYTEAHITFDQTIARGLDYYTGVIYETSLKALPGLGSVCSGGRYDHLIATLGGPDLPAVGTSLGVDRLFDGLQQLGVLKNTKTPAQVLVAHFGEASEAEHLRITTLLRRGGIPTELYYEPAKIGKQLQFADRMGIPFGVLVGSNELARGTAKVKILATGEEVELPVSELLAFLQEKTNQEKISQR
jgi:histidyl-tRNA synthetase